MDFDSIIKKYNYSDYLANFLRKIYMELIEYFGKDKELIIYEAFLNTEVVDCSNIYDYLSNNREITENKVINAERLKMAAGICVSDSEVVYDEESGTYKLNNINRLLLVCNLSQNEDYVKGTLIHELGHLIKNYYKSHEIVGDMLIVREGFAESIYKLSYENGKVKETLIKKEGIGLEEGLNSILEHYIAKVIVNPNYYVSGYNVVRELASILTDNLGLKDEILNAQVMKEKEAFARDFDLKFMDGAFKRFEDLLDRIYILSLNQTSARNSDSLVSITKEIDDIVKNEFAQLLNEMAVARNSKRTVA